MMVSVTISVVTVLSCVQVTGSARESSNASISRVTAASALVLKLNQYSVRSQMDQALRDKALDLHAQGHLAEAEMLYRQAIHSTSAKPLPMVEHKGVANLAIAQGTSFAVNAESRIAGRGKCAYKFLQCVFCLLLAKSQPTKLRMRKLLPVRQ